MSSPLSPPSRKQLDELDALLERMLALPVDGTPEQPSASTAVTPQLPPEPPAPPVPTFRIPSGDATPAEPLPQLLPPTPPLSEPVAIVPPTRPAAPEPEPRWSGITAPVNYLFDSTIGSLAHPAAGLPDRPEARSSARPGF